MRSNRALNRLMMQLLMVQQSGKYANMPNVFMDLSSFPPLYRAGYSDRSVPIFLIWFQTASFCVPTSYRALPIHLLSDVIHQFKFQNLDAVVS